MTQNTNNLAADIWTLADLLRGDFKQSQYGRIILPFTLLRRLECVLETSKDAVLKQVVVVEKMNLPEEAQEKLLLRATGGLSFFNTSPMDLSTLGEAGIRAIAYVNVVAASHLLSQSQSEQRIPIVRNAICRLSPAAQTAFWILLILS